mgnify:CR=1 FL=1
MHPYKRSERLGELILTEISDLVRREIKDPRIGFVTFTRVQLSEDLRYAKVFVSILGTEDEQSRTLAGLASAVGYIRRHLGIFHFSFQQNHLIFHIFGKNDEGVDGLHCIFHIRYLFRILSLPSFIFLIPNFSE